MVTTMRYQPTLQAQDPLQHHSFVELGFEMPTRVMVLCAGTT
ncbi:hypothetical protein RSAG8_03665, partial [Rhizoctonia solani AG-8 WAC10335]